MNSYPPIEAREVQVGDTILRVGPATSAQIFTVEGVQPYSKKYLGMAETNGVWQIIEDGDRYKLFLVNRPEPLPNNGDRFKKRFSPGTWVYFEGWMIEIPTKQNPIFGSTNCVKRLDNDKEWVKL